MAFKTRPQVLPLFPPGFRGAYSVAVVPATAASPGANTDYFSMRWTSTTSVCVITNAFLQTIQTTASTAGVPTFGLFVARSYSVVDSGGTAVTLTGNELKKRTSYQTTQVADMRFGSGGAITAGTRTLDGQPFVAATNPITINTSSPHQERAELAAPLILSANEGIVLRNMVAQTTGVTRMYLRLEWIELNGTVV